MLSKVVPSMEICQAHQQVEVERYRELVEDGHYMLPLAIQRFVKNEHDLKSN